MKLSTALNHFKTTPTGLARILHLDPSTVNKWKTVVPLDKAALLQRLSYNAIEIDWACYDAKGRPVVPVAPEPERLAASG